MEAAHQEMSQAEFARAMNVSRAAVSQWKSKDILREDAFTKPGKSGKVIFSVALDQVRRNRDIGQALGNGLATRTSGTAHDDMRASNGASVGPDQNASGDPVQPDLPESARQDPVDRTQEGDPPASVNASIPKPDTIEDQLKRAKLEEQLRRNRMKAAEEALQSGLLMSSDEAREQMARIAGQVLQLFEGALPDFAARIAEKFGVPQRDVLHLLREETRKLRSRAAEKERERAGVTPQLTAASVTEEI
jgi:predicted XRE-type DNA-binding protein